MRVILVKKGALLLILFSKYDYVFMLYIMSLHSLHILVKLPILFS